jgi:hypothetical protein
MGRVTRRGLAAIAAITTVALPGPSFSQVFTSSSAQKYLQEKLPLLSSCLTTKAGELDDGHSDVAAIAAAVASACQKVELDIYAGYTKIMETDPNPVLIDSPEARQMLKILEQQAVGIVVKERAAKTGQQK